MKLMVESLQGKVEDFEKEKESVGPLKDSIKVKMIIDEIE